MAESERAQFQCKIDIYKDQVDKMRQNLDLYKESMTQLQNKNKELEQLS